MVLRYWGKPGVLAEDFAPLVEPRRAGIPTGAMVKEVEARGWIAFPLTGTPSELEDHLAHGRPVIALIRTSSGSFHYVVLVAWANGWVILHDPNVGPFRTIREAEFNTVWSGSGHWALLVLPPHATTDPGAPESAPVTSLSLEDTDGCEALVDSGVLLAQQGDSAGAELTFKAAQTLWPASASPLRERAGLRFRAGDWPGAIRLAERSLVLDPGDADAWRLLAGSRFLAGDVEGALRAWNRLSEPRADLTHIDGLTRIRFSAVAGQLGLPPGRLLTPRAFRQARRRLAEVPAQLASRLSLIPLAGGNAQVNVALVERPPVLDGPLAAASLGIKALVGREITLNAASPTGNGELWTAGWRWWANRPRVSLDLAIPAAGGRPGIWRGYGFWERQSYAVRDPSGLSGTTSPGMSREERRRSALSLSDWIGPDVRVEIGGALDHWADRGSHLSLEGTAETRWAHDRLALGASMANWVSLANRAPFGAGDLSLRWHSNGPEGFDSWQGLVEISSATNQAPLALWSGAGTGQGRAPLLRAHPLLNRGIIEGPMFGRTLVHGTIERQEWTWKLGPLRAGWAFFVDGARPWDTGTTARSSWLVDGGTGLRLRGLGQIGQVRIDAAHGLIDGRSALSAAWEIS